MRGQPYYTLLASLPPLPRFDRAERLPITRERLLMRAAMLTSADAERFEYVAEFLAWQRQTATRSDAEMIASFKKLEAHISHPDLQKFLELPVDESTIMAALRRRQRGRAAPSAGELWGVGRYVRHIEKYWESPHFKLSAVYPWIVQARTLLEAGETLALERLLMDTIWDHADRSVKPYDTGFKAVLSYIIKWDILDQWLSYGVEEAGKRFEELVAEVIDEQ